MSKVTIMVPPPLRRFVDGRDRLEAEASTAREAVNRFTECSADLHGHLFDETQSLRRFVRVFVNGQPARLGPSQDEPLDEGAEVTILLALAGG